MSRGRLVVTEQERDISRLRISEVRDGNVSLPARIGRQLTEPFVPVKAFYVRLEIFAVR